LAVVGTGGGRGFGDICRGSWLIEALRAKGRPTAAIMSGTTPTVWLNTVTTARLAVGPTNRRIST